MSEMDIDPSELEPGVYTVKRDERHTRLLVVPERRTRVEKPSENVGQRRLTDNWSRSKTGEDHNPSSNSA